MRCLQGLQCLQALSRPVPHWSLTDLKPAAAELSRAAGHEGKQGFDPARTGSVTPSETAPHMPALSKSPGASSCLLCGVEVRAFPTPRLDFSSLLLGVRVCNLLFCCRWLVVPGLRLLSLRLRRDEKLDLLCADGDFTWLEPPFEMFQGALIGIKSIHKKL